MAAVGMALAAVLALQLGAAFAASAAGAPNRGRLLAATADTRWTLVGEWDNPGYVRSDPWSHYTTSIVSIDGAYYLAAAGALLGGCCFWPHVWAMESTEDGAFLEPFTGATYRVREDGRLAIHHQDGREFIASPTRSDERFSSGWEEGVRAQR